jgi:hypothetical protein
MMFCPSLVSCYLMVLDVPCVAIVGTKLFALPRYSTAPISTHNLSVQIQPVFLNRIVDVLYI